MSPLLNKTSWFLSFFSVFRTSLTLQQGQITRTTFKDLEHRPVLRIISMEDVTMTDVVICVFCFCFCLKQCCVFECVYRSIVFFFLSVRRINKTALTSQLFERKIWVSWKDSLITFDVKGNTNAQCSCISMNQNNVDKFIYFNTLPNARSGLTTHWGHNHECFIYQKVDISVSELPLFVDVV